jgi:lysophospholipase L1-like esterase
MPEVSNPPPTQTAAPAPAVVAHARKPVWWRRRGFRFTVGLLGAVGLVVAAGLAYALKTGWGGPGRDTIKLQRAWAQVHYALDRHPLHSPARERLRAFQARPPNAHNTVMLGDSLTEQADWQALLGAEHLNRGLNGANTQSTLRLLKRILPDCAVRIHLLMGINDFQGRLLRGMPGEQAVAEAAEHHDRLVRAIQQRCPQAQLRVQALLPVDPVRESRGLDWIPPANFVDLLAQLNHRLAAQANAAGVPFADLGETLRAADGTLDPALSKDGMHLNAAGYRRWAAALRDWKWELRAAF